MQRSFGKLPAPGGDDPPNDLSQWEILHKDSSSRADATSQTTATTPERPAAKEDTRKQVQRASLTREEEIDYGATMAQAKADIESRDRIITILCFVAAFLLICFVASLIRGGNNG